MAKQGWVSVNSKIQKLMTVVLGSCVKYHYIQVKLMRTANKQLPSFPASFFIILTFSHFSVDCCDSDSVEVSRFLSYVYVCTRKFI